MKLLTLFVCCFATTLTEDQKADCNVMDSELNISFFETLNQCLYTLERQNYTRIFLLQNDCIIINTDKIRESKFKLVQINSSNDMIKYAFKEGQYQPEEFRQHKRIWKPMMEVHQHFFVFSEKNQKYSLLDDFSDSGMIHVVPIAKLHFFIRKSFKRSDEVILLQVLKQRNEFTQFTGKRKRSLEFFYLQLVSNSVRLQSFSIILNCNRELTNCPPYLDSLDEFLQNNLFPEATMAEIFKKLYGKLSCDENLELLLERIAKLVKHEFLPWTNIYQKPNEFHRILKAINVTVDSEIYCVSGDKIKCFNNIDSYKAPCSGWRLIKCIFTVDYWR